MGVNELAKLSDSTRKQLRAIAQKQAEKIAKEFEEKMSKKYESLIDLYYGEPYQTNPPHYKRTGNLRNSYIPYFNTINSTVIGGIEVTGENMKDYGRKKKLSGEDYLSHFYFSPNLPSATWHGGDWHGGYGVMAGFSAYSEMVNYYIDTVKDFRKRYGV